MPEETTPFSLTEMDKAVIDLIEQGLGRLEISEALGRNESTVRDRMKRLCNRFDCPSKDLPEVTRPYR